MKLRTRKGGIATPVLVLVTLVGAGCNQSPDSIAPMSAQAATSATQTPLKQVAAASTLSPQIGTNHEFVFVADKGIKSVSVVGSFNKWNKLANPMSVDADSVTWRITLPLNYGRYVYKFAQFVTASEESWVPDPHAPLDATDKVNDNSVLAVIPADYNLTASPTDGKTATSILLHSKGTRDLSYDDGKISLSIRVRPGDLRQITLVSSSQRYPMKLVTSDDLYAHYKTTLPWSRKQDLSYRFELADGNRVRQFGADGLGTVPRPFKISARDFQPYLLTDASEPLKMSGPLTTQKVAGPSWAKTSQFMKSISIFISSQKARRSANLRSIYPF